MGSEERPAGWPSAGCRTARSTSSSAIGRTWITTIWTACPRRWTRRSGSPSSRPRDRWWPARTGRRSWPTGRVDCARGPIGRSSASSAATAGDRPVPLPHRQLPDAAGRRPATGPRVPGPAGGNAPGQPGTLPGGRRATRSTSSCSATTWACRTGRRCRRRCTRSSSSRGTRACGAGPRNWPNVKVMLHCCGGVQPLLPHLIEAGLDAINPVQISCTGMDPRGLKQRVRPGPDVLGRRLRYASGPVATGRPTRFASTCVSRSRSSSRAAASCSSRSTTSWPTCRRRTSSPCSKQRTHTRPDGCTTS